MAFLKNRNGENYKIIGSRPSKYKGRKDYLVQSKSGCVTIAHGWQPESKCWVAGDCYGWGERALQKAKDVFSKDPLAYSAERFGKGKKRK